MFLRSYTVKKEHKKILCIWCFPESANKKVRASHHPATHCRLTMSRSPAHKGSAAAICTIINLFTSLTPRLYTGRVQHLPAGLSSSGCSDCFMGKIWSTFAPRRPVIDNGVERKPVIIISGWWFMKNSRWGKIVIDGCPDGILRGIIPLFQCPQRVLLVFQFFMRARDTMGCPVFQIGFGKSWWMNTFDQITIRWFVINFQTNSEFLLWKLPWDSKISFLKIHGILLRSHLVAKAGVTTMKISTVTV